MLSPQERGEFVNLGNRLIDLHLRRAEACGQEDRHRVRALQRRSNALRLGLRTTNSIEQIGLRPFSRRGHYPQRE